MIGNDIVDLSLAGSESNWQRKGFLEKVFSREEQTMIYTAQNMDQMVWLLWSFKEAAYKAHQRLKKHSPILNWLRQKCNLISITPTSALGIVSINGEHYFTASEITSEYIHTTARKHENDHLKNMLFEGPSEAVKKLLLTKIADHFSLCTSRLSFQKNNNGIPFISYNNTLFFTDFSFSDHGRYSGFSLSLRIS